jgi:serine/alanine adding enzyme
VTGWLTAAEYAAAWRRRDDSDPYFRPEFLDAAVLAEPAGWEAFAHGDVLYPFLVRPLPDGRADVTSAYGFGGPAGRGAWRAAFAAECRRRGIVSEFIRFHPTRRNHEGDVDGVELSRIQEAVVLDVRAGDDELLARMVPQGRNKLRKAMRSGVDVREGRDLDGFAELYWEAMARIGAREAYLFPREYFHALDRLGDALLLLDAGCAKALFLRGGGAMHYFLAASDDEGRRLAATNLVLFEAMRIARDGGLTLLNLGGGQREGDTLHRFKMTFGPGRAPYVVGRALHDPETYAELCEQRGADPAGGFFPAYRGPVVTASG